ncbi:hypothetical protein KAFR_0A05810 [Kazachstania africana CBS 2517]|uniref:Uncharacterized protein n=1 Tax=Kazachstania africana (strain ATCC 22294 / BCRC 22015 / CBS 2517 / CECT 1963 / NBRC 1671 / NRRL Y-8276) TaxID=1071382 RepID=H2ANR6_KAZAF|nr:hypothetical protein KAFR_0A05810 [Kazachstania africana CBS 2517]CCF56016.1 hypothetical protein KAFR_0A05810 [Kazachstania africana CBS 2517]
MNVGVGNSSNNGNKTTELDQLFKNVIKNHKSTKLSDTIDEINRNNRYIMETQFKKLLKLHDKSFNEKSVLPMYELYKKYYNLVENDLNIQNEAAILDRDLRIIEMTIGNIKKQIHSNIYCSYMLEFMLVPLLHFPIFVFRSNLH